MASTIVPVAQDVAEIIEEQHIQDAWFDAMQQLCALGFDELVGLVGDALRDAARHESNEDRRYGLGTLALLSDCAIA